MKTLFIISSFLIIFSCSCTRSSNQQVEESILKKRVDTIIRVQDVPVELRGSAYKEKEYFVVIKNDTSSFSWVTTQYRIGEKISMYYRYDPYGDIPYRLYLNDTVAVAEKSPVLKKIARKLSYKEQLRELRLILNYAAKDFDLSRLNMLRFGMSSIEGLSLDLTRLYLSEFGEKFRHSGSQNAKGLLEASRLIGDLNKILASYSLRIDGASIEKLHYFTPLSSPKGTKPMLDGSVFIKLAAIP